MHKSYMKLAHSRNRKERKVFWSRKGKLDALRYIKKIFFLALHCYGYLNRFILADLKFVNDTLRLCSWIPLPSFWGAQITGIEKQSSGGVLQKRFSLKFRKIHRKISVPESLLKHQNNIWNLFDINQKGTETSPSLFHI